MLRIQIIVIVSFFTLFLILFSSTVPDAAVSISDDDGYKMPPKHIADLVDAPWTPGVSISPDYEYLLIRKWPGLKPIEELAQPELRLAGYRINPGTNAPSRGWRYNEFLFKKIPDGKEMLISGLPEDPVISEYKFSPDGKKLAFILTEGNRLELWVADVRTAEARKIVDGGISAAFSDPYEWFPDGRELLVKMILPDRGEAPQKPLSPHGPNIQSNTGGKTPARTYQDLLENKYDEQLFEHYFTSRIFTVDLKGNMAPVGEPGIIMDMKISPDGDYILTQTIHRPFSYTVPAYRFPRKIEVLDIDGKSVFVVDDLALADDIPISYDSVRKGKRRVGWRQDEDATLYWVQALDEGNADIEAEHRDGVYTLEAPFDGQPRELIKLGFRCDNLYWYDDDLAIVTESWWKTRQERFWTIKPGNRNTQPNILFDRSYEDRYNDPGNPVTTCKDGRRVLLTSDKGRSIFLIGQGASPEGERPFIDEYHLKSGSVTRLFRSESPYYQSPQWLIDPKKKLLVFSEESIEEPPNYILKDLRKGKETRLTSFPHPMPQMKGVHKELITYQRDDGVRLSATLYLPPNYNPDDGPLPMLMWAYPREFKSADAASQVKGSPYNFVRIWWSNPKLWLIDGWAVLDGPTMPIVGEGDEEPNDTYVKQLVASAKAAIDEVVRRGVADRNRIAIGGHSYGAFMVANLLAHSDLFKAGIARSGAYNRTLTPFGFQSENRTLWEAPEVYFRMSPFMHADKVNEPILLIHGEADNNSGTYPMQSRRFYDALKGNGAVARLVMLPHESHGYRARESAMHVLWETKNWLDTYVRNR
ncbi:MAG: prolyl oligopeptidase family serine peptidase [candidate division Zixibacteria bacterium]|nr:prolyl oligopeptidase family serine peptidase [candidate division Zixibacteria bacterium]